MKLNWTGSWRRPDREFSVSDAVEVEVDGGGNERGALEEVKSTSANTARMLGLLMELLNEKGLLTNAEVLKLLGGHSWKEVV